MKYAIIQTFPFIATDSQIPYERYPNLIQGTYSFSFQIDDEQYYVHISYSESTNSAFLSLFDSNNTIVVSNLLVVPEVRNGYPNYLALFKFMNRYALSYQQQNKQFVLWEIQEK